MCYEFWRNEQQRADEVKARKRAQEMIEKARAATPASSEAPRAAEREEEKETVPA